MLSVCCSGKQMDPWAWPRVPTSLQPQSWRVREVDNSLGPWSTRTSLYNCEAHLQAERRSQTGSEHTGRGERLKGRLRLWFEPEAPKQPLVNVGPSTAVDMDRTRLSCILGGGGGPQRPNAPLLSLASSYRWREVLYTVLVSVKGTLFASCLLTNWHLMQQLFYTGTSPGSNITKIQHRWTLFRVLVLYFRMCTSLQR